MNEKFEKLPYFEQPQQPSKHIEVPAGATHWSSCLARPFFKVKRVELEGGEALYASFLTESAFPSAHPKPESYGKCIYVKEDNGLLKPKWFAEYREQFFEGKWCEANPVIPRGRIVPKFTENLVPLEELNYSEHAFRINTKFGDGLVVGSERKTGRLYVELDDQTQFNFNPIVIFSSEILEPAI